MLCRSQLPENLAGSQNETPATKKHPYSARTARTFCTLLSESDQSVTALCKAHPELPHPLTLYRWRDKHPYFATLWRRAREAQAEHLMQRCLDLAAQATPKNAHAQRIKFDIYKFFGAKILPALYGDKPSTNAQSVSVAVVIPPERLNALRAKLDASRSAFAEVTERKERKEERTEALPDTLITFDREKARKALPENGKSLASMDNSTPVCSRATS